MKLLIDSHIFIWWQDEPKKLSAKFSNAIFDTSNTIYLSLVSLWEMQLKIQTGKLHLSVNLSKAIETVQKANDLQILPIESAHVYELENLPFHHKDPFDRLLIAQANIENLTLVTDDPKFSAYSAHLL